MRDSGSFDIRRLNLSDNETVDMDRITEALVGEFVAEYSLQSLKPPDQFEYFSAFVTVKRHFGRSFQPSDIVTGGPDDTGIDAIAVIVNGVLVTEPETVDVLLEQNGFINSTFIFIQAERSSSFDAAKIRGICAGVRDFFAIEPSLRRNEKIVAAAEIMAAVYEKSSAFKGRPDCRLYYVTTGTWVDDKVLVSAVKQSKADILGMKIFENVDFQCLGSDELQKLYALTRKTILRDFVFEKRTEVPEIDGVETAYMGYIPVKDFLNIITHGTEDRIVESIFYDNVRDWQDYNSVNSGIRKTLKSENDNRFVLMNNGTTIIASAIKLGRHNKVTIEDFQIVNGCQTSHVLFDMRSKIANKKIFVPIRVIVTKNEDVIHDVILATNSQTALRQDQLFALTDFSRKLEKFFATYPEEHKLYYERRTCQYDRQTIEKTRKSSRRRMQFDRLQPCFLRNPIERQKIIDYSETRLEKRFLQMGIKLNHTMFRRTRSTG